MTRQTVFLSAVLAWMLAAGCTQCAGSDGPAELFKAPDLSPVTMLTSPKHEPVTIVQDGKAGAVVYVAVAEPTENLKRMVSELVEVILLSTGAELKLPRADGLNT